jgi:glutathione S-transferase
VDGSSVDQVYTRRALPAATLYALPASHPSAAVELALRLKGVEYRRVDMIPVVSKLQQWARFRGSTVPAIEFADGEKVLGSREIIRALEHRAPDPPMLPADGNRRRHVEEAERWGDEVLQPLARRLAWASLLRSTESMMGDAADADLPVPDPLVRVSAPVVARASAYFNGAGDPAVRADLINLDFHLDRADRWIETGAVGGTELPNAGDLQIGAGVRLLLTIEDLVPRIEGRPCREVALRWFPEYPGQVPAGTLPRAWLEARAPARV